MGAKARTGAQREAARRAAARGSGARTAPATATRGSGDGSGAPSVRRVLGAWLDGPQSLGVDPGAPPGVRLGLPAHGPGAIASQGRRLAAFLVDVVAGALIGGIVRFFVHHPSQATIMLAVNLAFLVEVTVLTALSGQSMGMRMAGIAVIGDGGRPPRPHWALLRTVLVMLLIPPLLQDRDRRGLHDRVTGTAVVFV